VDKETLGEEKSANTNCEAGIVVSFWVKLFEAVLYMSSLVRQLQATSYTPGSFNDILLNGALTMYTTFPVAVD
jgi:hypothetical protein